MHIQKSTILVAIGVLALLILGFIALRPEQIADSVPRDVEVVETPTTEEQQETLEASPTESTSPPTPAPQQPSLSTPPSTSVPQPTEDPAAADESSPQDYVLLAENDTTSNITVAVASLTQPGYVVIYKINSLGKSSMRGHSRLLQPGIYTNFKIQLTGIVAKKEIAVAVIHVDDGDGEFEYPGADSYLFQNGVIVSDIDVIEVQPQKETDQLEKRIEEYIEESV